MFTLLGILVILLAIAAYVVAKRNKGVDEFNEQVDIQNKDIKEYKDNNADGWRKSYVEKRTHFQFISMNPKLLGLIGLGIILLNGFFFINPAGTITSVQYLWGGDTMVETQGLKIKAWGRTIPLSYEISIKDVIVHENEDLQDSGEGIYNRHASKWEFADAIKADIETAVIIEIITDNDSTFLAMADRNRSEGKLIGGRVLPSIDAALKNTCKLMDAQDYISGASSEFDRYFRDQLQNGMYVVEEYYDAERKPEVIGDTLAIRTVGVVAGQSSSKQKKYKIKRDASGEPIRDNASNSLKNYGIKFVQAMVTSIDWEKSFDDRLDLQKDEVAKTQLEKQEAERQYYTAKKNEAEAESNKVARRGVLELAQIEETIKAETLAKAAKYKEEEETNLYNAASMEAKKIKILADAEAYKNLKLVQAGLTPQERRTMDEKMNNDKWVNIGKMKFDGVYMMDGAKSKGSDGLLSALLGAEVAKGMKPSK